jgi:hypothetical protein
VGVVRLGHECPLLGLQGSAMTVTRGTTNRNQRGSSTDRPVMTADFRLGDRVIFTRHLRRRVVPSPESARRYKKWLPEAFAGEREPEPREGIVIGTRYLQNGYTRDIYCEGQWVVEETIKTYLIAFHDRKAPVYVLPEHVRPQLTAARS